MERVQSAATNANGIRPQKQIHAARNLLYGDFMHPHGNNVSLVQVGFTEREGHISLYSLVAENVAIMMKKLHLPFFRLHQLLHTVE